MRIIIVRVMDVPRALYPERAERLRDTGPAAPRRISSDALLGMRGELVITHNGREYHLRVTQNGKLILTA
jgi:hemin uptake protein HemP